MDPPLCGILFNGEGNLSRSRTFRRCPKSARAITALGPIGSVSLAVIVRWVTGFFASITSIVAGLWNNFMGWINSPLG